MFKGERSMPKSSERNRSSSNSSSRSGGNSGNSGNWGVMEMARERPIAAAAAAAGAAAAGLFLWSRRAQISNQLSNLSDQIGEWSENWNSGDGQFGSMDDTAGLTSSSSRSSGGGGGNASLGTSSGGAGMTSSASGRGRAQQSPTT
jgi:hypothetical protein